MGDLIRVGIVGGTDSCTGELLRLLPNHPAVEIVFVHHPRLSGISVAAIHPGIDDESDLRFTDEFPIDDVDLVFLCCSRGGSSSFLAEHFIPADVRLIDLSGDYCLNGEEDDFVYGLPELNRWQLMGARYIVNPGSLSTTILLALAPLVANNWVDGDVVIHTLFGTSESKQRCFSRGGSEGIRTPSHVGFFDAFSSIESSEILQGLRKIQPSFDNLLDIFLCQCDFSRGMLTSVVTHSEASEREINEAFKTFYEEAPFTHYIDKEVNLNEIINTNKSMIHAEKCDDRLFVSVGIDNLLKGAAGQALQNMNLMFGLEETTGLRLKSMAF